MSRAPAVIGVYAGIFASSATAAKVYVGITDVDATDTSAMQPSVPLAFTWRTAPQPDIVRAAQKVVFDSEPVMDGRALLFEESGHGACTWFAADTLAASMFAG